MLSVGAMRNFFNRFGSGCAIAILCAFAIPLIAGYSNFGNRGGNPRAEAGSKVIAIVNGQNVTEADFQEMLGRVARGKSPEPGPLYASTQGETMLNVIEKAIILQEAERRHARALDADIDKELDQDRDSVAKRMNKTKLTDQEWENFVETNLRMTVSDLRERLAKDLIPVALVNQIKAGEKVTESEAKNQSAMVQLTLLKVPYIDPANPPPATARNKPTLKEAEAKQKIDSFYQEIKGGKDIGAVAKTNSYDPEGAKNGGKIGSIQEYPNAGQGGLSFDLNLLYGPELAEAVHKLTDGQNTDVLKLGGLEKGSYGIVKLVARKVETPKNFDIKKAIDNVAQQRAIRKFKQLVRALTQSAKIEFKDLDKKAYYDFSKMEKVQSDAIEDAQNGIVSTPPTKAELDAQNALVYKQFEDMLKRNPEDTTAAILVAENIKAHHSTEPGAQDRLITLNEQIVKTTGDYNRHFELADAYRDKRQLDKAKAHLDRVSKLLSYNDPTDLDSMKAADTTHRRLESGYRLINANAEADKERFIIDDLQRKITAAALKQQMEQREAAKQAAAQRAADAARQKANKANTGKTGAVNTPDGANTITMPMTSGDPTQSLQITPPSSGDSGIPNLGAPGGPGSVSLPTTPPGKGPPAGKKP